GRVSAAVKRSVATGTDHDIECRIVRADGTVRWLHGRGRVLRGPTGRVVRMVGLCVDVSGRKQAEEERAGLLARERMARAEAEAAAERLRRLQGVTDAALARLDIEHLSRQLVAPVRAALNADPATVLP